ncbi:tumor protein D52 isoform X1 [Conger conger]|uniref:tumor protein D52 isoform X1 n=1 Tax=Conger conger TaxID=82655 RepID=UPI002A5A2FB7|nr:tumor protein D52 isoform X1 [Conger conger]
MDPAEDYKSPFDFEQGVNTSYLYLSPSDSVTPPGSPATAVRVTPRPDSIPEVGEDAAASVGVTPTTLTQEEQEELRSELAKVEDEILTLSQVLAAKEKHVAEIKRKLGMSPLNEFKQNLTKSWQEVTTSVVYRRTSETLSQAGQKATAAFSSVGSAISRKLEDVRNTPTFKSFEGRVETLKTKVSPAESTGDFGEVLNSTASAAPPPEATPEVEVPPADSEEPH